MNRRSFVKGSILTTSVSSILPMTSPDKKPARQFYELRSYQLKNDLQQNSVETYFRDAAIPALNRLGSKSVGLFKEKDPQGERKMVALIPFNSLDDFLRIEQKLSVDPGYLQAAGSYLNAPASEPAYERIESSLLQGFAQMPGLDIPAQKTRLFELRRYESASEAAGAKKIEMFNDAGEIGIFKRLGFAPVFFGETLIGPLRPNLTYMVTFDDMADHDSKWKQFGSDPEWKQVSAIPEYADAKIVSRITSVFLVPSDCSQI